MIVCICSNINEPQLLKMFDTGMTAKDINKENACKGCCGTCVRVIKAKYELYKRNIK